MYMYYTLSVQSENTFTSMPFSRETPISPHSCTVSFTVPVVEKLGEHVAMPGSFWVLLPLAFKLDNGFTAAYTVKQ